MKILTFLLLLFLVPALSNACTCAFPTFDEQMKTAIAVFTGKVVESSPQSEGLLRVDLIMTKKWKAPAGEKISIYTPDDTAACGYRFKNEEEYLVFATDEGPPESDGVQESSVENTQSSNSSAGAPLAGPRFRVSLCSLTKRVADAGAELKKLNARANSKESRDPFTEMRGDKIQENKFVPKALNITNAVIVGITKKNDGFIALVRALNNKVYFLKVGDKLHDGIVVKIDFNSVTFRQNRGRRSVLIRKELRPFPDE